MAGRYFEQWKVGDRVRHEIHRTVTRPWVLMEVCGGQTMPDVNRIGGVTGWMRAAGIADRDRAADRLAGDAAHRGRADRETRRRDLDRDRAAAGGAGLAVLRGHDDAEFLLRK